MPSNMASAVRSELVADVVLQALADLHPDRAHRDLKLSNLVTENIFTQHCSVKLLDWANSRLHSEGRCVH